MQSNRKKVEREINFGSCQVVPGRKSRPNKTALKLFWAHAAEAAQFISDDWSTLQQNMTNGGGRHFSFVSIIIFRVRRIHIHHFCLRSIRSPATLYPVAVVLKVRENGVH